MDFRQLNTLKLSFLNADKIERGFLDCDIFKQLFRKAVKNWDIDLEKIVLQHLIDEDGFASFKKLSQLVDMYHHYPLIVKKDRNFS